MKKLNMPVSTQPTQKSDMCSIAQSNLVHRLRTTDCVHPIGFKDVRTSIFPKGFQIS